MADSRRLRILNALKSRIEAIEVSNGFNTDAGQRVYLGELPELGPNDPEAVIAIIPREDIVGAALNNIPIQWPIDIVVLVQPDIAAPWIVVENALADIKKAVELEDRTLGDLLIGGRDNPGGLVRGTTEVFPRPTGAEVSGASITYMAPFAEAWGFPES